MSELLTTKQIIDLLQVDRTTVYRMLKDGRIHGVKVGQQWRFPRETIEQLLRAEPTPPAPRQSAHAALADSAPLPAPILQALQDVFAGLAGVGSITTDTGGIPCTRMSNPCRYCQLIYATKTGQQRCIASWRALSFQNDKQTSYYHCHAGLRYARTLIELDDSPELMLVVGQFLTQHDAANGQAATSAEIASQLSLDPTILQEAAAEIQVINDERMQEMQALLTVAGATLEQLGQERAGLYNRLRQISPMSAIEAS